MSPRIEVPPQEFLITRENLTIASKSCFARLAVWIKSMVDQENAGCSIREGYGQSMFEDDLAFQVGDQVIHWVYGLGEIIQLDEKVLSGKSCKYYVVKLSNMTLWVPMTEVGEHHLRFPTQAKDFENLVSILASPGESLPPDRHARRMYLTDLLEDGTLASICRVVRDLEHYKKGNKTNEYDHSILERARDSLVTEWSVALSMPVPQVEHELNELLV